MTQKISFSIENAEMINENPNSSFAVMSLDFFASGKNLHDMYVSEETLLRTADSIKNCPLVWKYDEELDDVYTHTPDEVPCGFVPEHTDIASRTLEDGRTMLSVVAYVWKRYTGELLNFFKRDGGVKPVSVEMSVLETKEREDGLLELLDYKFEGITVLGTFVTPAIPLAKATVLSFSKEYNELFTKEFSEELNLIIPENIKFTAEKILKKIDSDPVEASIARYILENKFIRQEKVKYIHKNSEKIKNEKLLVWNDSLYKKIIDDERIHRQENEEHLVPDSNSENINPDLHSMKDGKWVTKSKIKMEMSMPEEKEKIEEMSDGEEVEKMEALPEKEEVKEEKMAEVEIEVEDKQEEDKEEEDKEEMSAVPAQFTFPKNFNMETIMSLFADKETEEISYAVEELTRGQFADPSVVMSGMFAKMCKMSEMIQKMAKDAEVYMSENESLKQFKADMEENKKMFEVESTLKQLSEKVAIPEEAKKEMLAEATKYSFANIDSWKTYCKAKSFDFSVIKQNEESNVVRVGMPFSGTAQKREDLWS